MEVYAPGVVKLLGEHAVVYGKHSLAVAIARHAKAEVSKSKMLGIRLPELSSSAFDFDMYMLNMLHEDYESKESIDEYCSKHSSIGIALPYATIAAYALANGADINKNITITSNIPFQKGFASSAACSTAFAVALLKGSGIDDATAIDIARYGERIAHKNENAGSIDISTSYLGGYVRFSYSEGASKEDIGNGINIVAIDTGPKKSTAETVAHVAELYKVERERTESIFMQIDRCTLEGIDALKHNDIERLGRLMHENQKLLAELGVSTERLDYAVKLAMENGAYGAKLSGGGGGGIAIAIGNAERVINAMKNNGFDAYAIDAQMDGARRYMLGNNA